MAKSKFEKTFIDRLTFRTTDHIINAWKAKYNQDDDLLSTDPLEDTLIISNNLLPTTVSETAPFQSIYLHNQIMREYILSTHKALAILRSIIRDIVNGQHTYSEVSSYLANMLLAKSLCLLLGIWYSHNSLRKTNNKEEYFVIDLFFKKPNFIETRIFNISQSRLNHSQFWKMFVEILKKTSGTHISNSLSYFINNVDYNDFSLIRNHLQYSYINWIFDDLQEDYCLDISWFENYTNNFNLDFKNFSNNSNKLFTLELLRLNNLLFKDIAVHQELKEHLVKFQKIETAYETWFN